MFEAEPSSSWVLGVVWSQPQKPLKSTHNFQCTDSNSVGRRLQTSVPSTESFSAEPVRLKSNPTLALKCTAGHSFQPPLQLDVAMEFVLVNEYVGEQWTCPGLAHESLLRNSYILFFSVHWLEEKIPKSQRVGQERFLTDFIEGRLLQTCMDCWIYKN